MDGEDEENWACSPRRTRAKHQHAAAAVVLVRGEQRLLAKLYQLFPWHAFQPQATRTLEQWSRGIGGCTRKICT